MFLDKIRDWLRKRKWKEKRIRSGINGQILFWINMGFRTSVYRSIFCWGVTYPLYIWRPRDQNIYLMTVSLLSWTIVLGVAAIVFIADEEKSGFITRVLNGSFTKGLSIFPLFFLLLSLF